MTTQTLVLDSPSAAVAAPKRRAIKFHGALLAVTLIALAVRLIAIGHDSFWYDEAIAAELAHAPVHDLLSGAARDNGNPPLYWVMLHGWASLAGYSEMALRFPSAVFGAAAVYALGTLTRRICNGRAGIGAATLLAISPFAIELSDEARVYALLHLVVILCTLEFVRWVESGRLADFLLYALCMAAAWYSHYFAFALPVAHGSALLLSPRGRKLIFPWCGAMALAGALFAPWAPTFIAQLHEPGNLERMGDRWTLQFWATPAVFAVGRTLAWRDSSMLLLVLTTLGSLFGWWAPAALGARRLLKNPLNFGLSTFWLLAPIALPLVVALLKTPLYHTRAASVGLPALLMLAGVGLSDLPAITLAAALGLIAVLSSLSLAQYFTKPLKDDWRDASPVVLNGFERGEVAVFDTMIEVSSFKYYAPDGKIPDIIIGITEPPTGESHFFGVRYNDGHRIDLQENACDRDVERASGVWLAMCVPLGSEPTYAAYLNTLGMHLQSEAHFHRIDLYHFTRSATPTTGAR